MPDHSAAELPIKLAFALIADLGCALGVVRINERPGCWEYQVDDKWWIALNGHREPTAANSPQHVGHPIDVRPFSCYIEYNGWPAGILTPFDGTIAAGSGANEDTFIAALQAAIVRAGGTPSE